MRCDLWSDALQIVLGQFQIVPGQFLAGFAGIFTNRLGPIFIYQTAYACEG